MQNVKIDNTWDRDITIPHNGEIYLVPQGGSKIVPWDAAASLFGDPRAANNGRDRGRELVYNQIRGLWNFYVGFDTELIWQDEKCPKFTATDPNTGDEIVFVIHDPDGTRGGYVPGQFRENPASTDQAILQSQIEDMQRSIAALTAALAASQALNTPATVPAPEIVPPSPTAEAGSDAATATATVIEGELPKVPEKTSVAKDTPRTVPTKR
jgi:hypothetical protein